MNNKTYIYFIAIMILLVFGMLVVFFLDVDCVFKSITELPCPGCGLTRGFRALFHGNIIRAEQYNILTIPIFLFITVAILLFFIDLIKHSNRLEQLFHKLGQHYKLIILIIFISWIINIIRGI